MAAAKRPRPPANPARAPRRVMLVHWRDSELPERIAPLRALGIDVATLSTPQATGQMRALREAAVDAVIIDLARLPSHGAEIARAVRQSPSTRHLPLLFLGGAPDKRDAVRRQLPDATYGDWSTIASSLADAMRDRPATPTRAPSGAAAYAGRALPQKLGIKPGARVALVDAPDDFATAFVPQVTEAVVRGDARGAIDVALWFVPDLAALTRGLPRWSTRDDVQGLWICWPKRASGRQTDLGETLVRERGLAAGLVDYKLCAIDATWSGLKFAWRGRARPGRRGT